MSNLTLDNDTFEVDEKVVAAYNKVVGERDTVKGQLDMAQAELNNLKTEMSGMIKADELTEKVREYQAVKDTADKFHVSLDEKMSVLDMKRAIIKAAVPALADGIDEKSEEYVNGAFSSCKNFTPATATDGADDVDDADDEDEEANKDGADDKHEKFDFDKANAALAARLAKMGSNN